MQIEIILKPFKKRNGYTVYAPALPGCISQGNNKKEAITNIKEAIELYLDIRTDNYYNSNKLKVFQKK